MYARQENFNLQFEQRPIFLKDMSLSRGAKDVYAVLYSQFKSNQTKVYEDNLGQYINMARSIIGDILNMSVKTVIKYIKELVDFKLIEDRRMGLNLVNRIYFKDHPFMVKINSSQNESEENSEEKSKLFDDARAILVKITNKRLKNYQVNQLLVLCNNDLDELQKAVDYNLGKDIKNVVACLADTLRNKYYEGEGKESKTSTTNNKKSIYKSKTNKFVEMDSRDINFDVYEKAEMLRIKLNFNEITEEEYMKELSKLNL